VLAIIPRMSTEFDLNAVILEESSWKRVAAIASGVCLLIATSLYLWQHNWELGILVGAPSFVLTMLELYHRHEANTLRGQANGFRDEANRLQGEANRLMGEQGKSLDKIATHLQKEPTLAEKNATRLRNYVGDWAKVMEGASDWGAMGRQIVEVDEYNVVTLFLPCGASSPTATATLVQCDQLELMEKPIGGCKVQINVLKTFGNTIFYGEAKSWEEAKRGTNVRKDRPRGTTVFRAHYRKDGVSTLRYIYVSEPTAGNPDYTLRTLEGETEKDIWYISSRVELARKFCPLQIEWLQDGWKWDNGTEGKSLWLFVE